LSPDKNYANFPGYFKISTNEDKQNEALLTFQKLIRETEPVRLNLKDKDILIVDNHRVFHGRTPIEGSKDRFLKRFWLSANKINNNN
jgi:alpha-ketoglutarate-dependent taurine dioxygenase